MKLSSVLYLTFAIFLGVLGVVNVVIGFTSWDDYSKGSFYMIRGLIDLAIAWLNWHNFKLDEGL